MHQKFVGCIFALCLALCSTQLYAESNRQDWTQWRGPDGQGHALSNNVPIRWGETSNVVWKKEILGRGWSSPIVADGKIWLTTAIETPLNATEAETRLSSNTGDQPLTLLDRVDLKVIALEQTTGALLHELTLFSVDDPQWVHKLNSYASPTPVYENGRLYCHFGTFGTACLDCQSTSIVWSNQELHVMHENGPGSTPIIAGEVLVFHMDGSDEQFIAALDKRSGKLAWKTPRSGEMRPNPQHKKSYGTPLLVGVRGKEQIVSPASDWCYGYEPSTGKELWKVAYGQLGFSVTPKPVVGHGMVYLITGFGKGQLLAIDVEKSAEPKIVWSFNKGTPTMPSPLLVGQEIYFVSDKGILTCLDALTGDEIYRDRLNGNFSSSPWFANGRIYVSNREGSTFVFAAGSKFELLAENLLPEPIMATPAVVDSSIYLRTEKHLYRIGE
jgi:outer membrane protein assembly factor BamB